MHDVQMRTRRFMQACRPCVMNVRDSLAYGIRVRFAKQLLNWVQLVM